MNVNSSIPFVLLWFNSESFFPEKRGSAVDDLVLHLCDQLYWFVQYTVALPCYCLPVATRENYMHPFKVAYK